MFKTRGRKILRDVLSRKGRTALVSISILIGVFGAVALISTNDLIIRQIKEDIQPNEVAMMRVYVTLPSAGTMVTTEDGSDQILDLVRSSINETQAPPGLVGATEIEGEIVAPVFWQKATEEGNYQEAEIMAFSEPFDQIKLEPPHLQEGEWPQPGRNEVAVEQRMADDHKFHVGDKIVFRPLGSNAAPEEWTISAIVYHPYWVQPNGGDGDSQPERRIFADLEDAKQIAGFTAYNSFYLRYVDTSAASDQAERLMETIAEKTNYIPLDYWLDNPDDYFLIGEVQDITGILNTLAIVALVVSGFLVANVINTIVVEQKRQIGVMKSIGASRWTSFTVYAGIALVYGIIGTIPGVILGVFVGSAMAHALARFAFTMIDGFKISPVGILSGVMMGLLVPVIAALLPVFNGTRVTILDALTDLGISGSWGKGVLARLIAASRLPVTVRQALSNVAQKKGRLFLTVITLMLAASAFMGVFAMFTVIQSEMDKLFKTFHYSISVLPTEAQDFDTVRQLIVDTGDVKEVLPGVGSSVRILNLNDTATAVGPSSEEELDTFGFDPSTNMLELTYQEGSGWKDDPTRRGIVITTAAAKSFDKKVGDLLLLNAGGQTAEYELIGVAVYPVPLAIMRWQDLATLAGFVTPDGEPVPFIFFATVKQEDPSAADVNRVINKISDSMLDAGITASFGNQIEEQEQTANDLLVFNLIFQMTSAVMAAVGAIGLLTTLSMAVFERQKEIGVMRSIGAGSSTIVAQFLVEGILIGILAWIPAVPLSYGLALVLLDGLGFSDFIQFSYPLWVLLMGLIGMIVVATIASLWPSLAAARRTVSDILRYQ
jgi:putative ABC transport system permease protein